MPLTLYRVYDRTDQNTLANSIPTREQAWEIIELLRLEFPNNELELESYTKYTVTGMGRDPDLH